MSFSTVRQVRHEIPFRLIGISAVRHEAGAAVARAADGGTCGGPSCGAWHGWDVREGPRPRDHQRGTEDRNTREPGKRHGRRDRAGHRSGRPERRQPPTPSPWPSWSGNSLLLGECSQQGAAAAGHRRRPPCGRRPSGRHRAARHRPGLGPPRPLRRRLGDSGQAPSGSSRSARTSSAGRAGSTVPAGAASPATTVRGRPSPPVTRWPSPPAAGHGRAPAPAAHSADTLDRRPVAARRRGRRPTFSGGGPCAR